MQVYERKRGKLFSVLSFGYTFEGQPANFQGRRNKIWINFVVGLGGEFIIVFYRVDYAGK